MGVKMDERRLRFCKSMVAGAGKRDAAVEAGYSERTAGSIASGLLKQKAVINMIAKLRKERDEAVDEDEARRLKDHYDTPLDLLTDVMNNAALPFSVRYKAALDAMPYVNAKPMPKGKKKDAKGDAEEAAGTGRFSVGRKPTLRSVA